MGTWFRSTATPGLLERSVICGGLPALTEAEEWLIPPPTHEVPDPPPGYVVSFAAFHERGLGVPASDFVRGLLAYWGIELQHLTPNGVLLLSIFTALCEVWLGIPPNWELFRQFMFVKIQYASGKKKSDKIPAPIGSVAIQLRAGRMKTTFPPGMLPTANTGWRSDWFYLKDDAARPLPRYTGRTFSEGSDRWREGPLASSVERVEQVTAKIKALCDAGLTIGSIIATWLERGVVPLRRCELGFWEMTQEKAPFPGTATAPALTAAQVDWYVSHVMRTPNRSASAPLALPTQATSELVGVVDLPPSRPTLPGEQRAGAEADAPQAPILDEGVDSSDGGEAHGGDGSASDPSRHEVSSAETSSAAEKETTSSAVEERKASEGPGTSSSPAVPPSGAVPPPRLQSRQPRLPPGATTRSHIPRSGGDAKAAEAKKKRRMATTVAQPPPSKRLKSSGASSAEAAASSAAATASSAGAATSSQAVVPFVGMLPPDASLVPGAATRGAGSAPARSTTPTELTTVPVVQALGTMASSTTELQSPAPGETLIVAEERAAEGSGARSDAELEARVRLPEAGVPGAPPQPSATPARIEDVEVIDLDAEAEETAGGELGADAIGAQGEESVPLINAEEPAVITSPGGAIDVSEPERVARALRQCRASSAPLPDEVADPLESVAPWRLPTRPAPRLANAGEGSSSSIGAAPTCLRGAAPTCLRLINGCQMGGARRFGPRAAPTTRGFCSRPTHGRVALRVGPTE